MPSPLAPNASLLARQADGLDRGQKAALANLPTAAVAAYVIRDSASIGFLAVWLSLVALAVTIRFGSTLISKRYQLRPSTRLTVHIIGSTLSGLAWGIAPVYLVFAQAVHSDINHIFIACIITATSAAALPSQCWYRPVYFGYLFGATPPLAAAFLWHGGEIHTAIATLVFLMIGVLKMTARQYGRTIMATLELQNAVDRLMHDLTAAHDEIALADRTKWQTLAHLSHELRTPMNAILGFSEMLSLELHGPLGSSKYRDYTHDIHASGTHTMAMIAELLELSEAQTGTLSIDRAPLDSLAVVSGAVDAIRNDAALKEIAIAFAPPATAPTVNGDLRKLRHVLDNVLANALRFTPQGGRISIDIGQDTPAALTIRIADTGIGMSALDIARALEPFGRLDDPMTRSHGGLGLGLPLAHRLVELHDGTLTIESAPGRGTTVMVTLPAILSAEAARPVPEAAPANRTTEWASDLSAA